MEKDNEITDQSKKKKIIFKTGTKLKKFLK